MDTEKDVIIIHCHMFKNAGTTFDWSLHRYFGTDFIDHREDVKMREGSAYLGAFLKQHKHLRALSSHHVQIPLPTVEHAHLIPAIILRHPIERVRSVYEFERNQQPGTPGAINAKKMSFGDYVRWRMEPSTGATIRNFQTRYCGGRLKNPKRNLTDHDLTEAIRFVRDTPLVGAVELFDESMVLFEQALRTWYPDIDFSYLIQNVGRNDNSQIAARIERIRQDLDAEIHSVLLKNNEYDLQLYSEARSLIQDRMIAATGFEHQLIDFRERCTQLKSPLEVNVASTSQQIEAKSGNPWSAKISGKLRKILK